MLRPACIPLFALMFAVAATLAGCNPNASAPANGTASTPPAEATDDHDHGHPSEGPHGGDLIELGNEEYHAELVHDASSVTIYILDGHAENAVPIDAADVTINIPEEDQPEQFKLTASPQMGDPEGKSSRFVSNDSALAEELEHHDDAQLSVSIAGKQYRGTIAHEHDHEHDHEAGAHEHESHANENG